jgi:hypothetical protein
MKMPIFLPKEFETEVFGTGDGFIVIGQKNNDGHETFVHLSVHQFETIFNHEKRLIKEAEQDDVSP